MGVDRESAVRKAEELVREGKIDLAIEEYLRLVDDPGDVGAANALGDLYVKTGNRVAAVQQFVQIGDHHRESGFIPKAVAFYKKALKADPACDHALSQLAAIAVEQELFADATLYLNRLLQGRRDRNDEAGVAACLVQLGGFPSATPEARLAAARAANQFAPDQAARLWVAAADALERAGRPGEAVDPLMQASTLEPDDTALRRRVALACATTGQLDRVRAFLSSETAGDHPDLLLALAEQALADGRDDEARAALQRVLVVAPDRRAEAETMLAPLVGGGAPEPESTLEPQGHTIPADFFTMDADVATENVETSSNVAAAPVRDESPSTGEPLDIEAAFGGGSAAGADDAEPMAASQEEAAPASEIDWASLLGDANTDGEPERQPEPEPQPEAEGALEQEFPVEAADDAVYVVPESELEPVPEPEPPPEPDLVAVPQAARDSLPPASRADLDSIAALTTAAQNPALQFQASAQLGRLLLRLGRVRDGIEWLEKASRAATPVREQRLDVMYELADALEHAGERGRALDVFADLDFDAASYRDVPERMAALRRELEEGPVP